jgi:hypothetical protein
MTAYRKNLVAWAGFFALALIFVVAANEISEWFMLGFFSIPLLARFVFSKIVCPKCGASANYQGTVFGIRINGGLVRRKCQECGWDLDRNP